MDTEIVPLGHTFAPWHSSAIFPLFIRKQCFKLHYFIVPTMSDPHWSTKNTCWRPRVWYHGVVTPLFYPAFSDDIPDHPTESDTVADGAQDLPARHPVGRGSEVRCQELPGAR